MANPQASTGARRAGDMLFSGEGLGVRKPGGWIIRDVDLTVRRGEIVTLIGPNGGGKSTTAKTVLGLVQPDAGSISMSPGTRIGYVPQRFTVDPSIPLTSERLVTMTGQADEGGVARALDMTGAAHLAQRPVQQLSGGEFQRVLLARAVFNDPDLLVLDEPVQGVDYAGELALYALIGRLRRKLDCGVLLISHDLHIVMAETDRVLCLNGHTCCSGSPQQVMNDQAYKALFGARGASALAVYRHAHEPGHDHDHHHSDHNDNCGCGDISTSEDRQTAAEDQTNDA